MTKLDGQLGRLAEALTLGGGTVAALVKQMKVVQARRDQLAAELEGMTATATTTWDAGAVRRALDRRLAEWRGALRRNAAQARQVLRKIISGRVIFTPSPEGVAFSFECELGKLLSGVALPKAVVAPTGFATACNGPSAGRRVPYGGVTV